MLQLRPHQQEVVDKLSEGFKDHRCQILYAPTGFGKTEVAMAIMQEVTRNYKKTAIVLDRIVLVEQTSLRLGKYHIDHGVIQRDHWRYRPDLPIQVCSAQTLEKRAIVPDIDLLIIDECHVMFKLYDKWMNQPEWKSVPFIGLTATPWQKGMGKKGRWDHLIIGTTTQDLINRGALSDFKVFAPAHPDLTGVKTVLGDYELKGLAKAMDDGNLVSDIVTTWLERGENRPTICFAVNRVHAKHIEQQFRKRGVSAEYMDAFTKIPDRNEILTRFSNGDTKIICNVGVLTTGFDADVRCIILARPTKSEILFVQMIGRGLRTAKGKDHCLILDHSDTTIRLGFVTDIHHDELDDGNNTKAKVERKVKQPKECPKCSFLRPPKMIECPSCGFKPEPRSQIEIHDGDLYELTRGKGVKANESNHVARQQFYSELLLHAYLRGYKKGWAYWAYQDKFKQPPDKMIREVKAHHISPATESWITARNIRKAKAKQKGAA